MKVSGINSVGLASALYEYTSTDHKTDQDSGSIESLLSSNMAANNKALTALSGKSKSTTSYQKTLKAADQTNALLKTLTDQKKSLYVKEKNATDDEEKAAYQAEAKSQVSSFVSSYHTLVANLAQTGGKTNKNFLSDLNQFMADHEAELAKAGVTRQEDGTLSLDAATLADAGMDTLSGIFGSDASFVTELNKKVDAIAERTATTVNTLQIYSTAYSNSGSYSEYEYIKGLYDSQA